MKMTGYKGFDKDLKCRDFQFEVGKEYEHDGKVKLCKSGFHFCENPQGVFGHYAPGNGSRFAVVEADEVSDERESDSKRVAKKLKIKSEISVFEMCRIAVDVFFENFGFKKKIESAVRQVQATTVRQVQATTVRQVQATEVRQVQATTVRQVQATEVRQVHATEVRQVQATTVRQVQATEVRQVQATEVRQVQATEVRQRSASSESRRSATPAGSRVKKARYSSRGRLNTTTERMRARSRTGLARSWTGRKSRRTRGMS